MRRGGAGGVLERGVNEAGIVRVRLFGTAGEALRSAVTAITALEAQASPCGICLWGLRMSWLCVVWEGRRAGRRYDAADP